MMLMTAACVNEMQEGQSIGSTPSGKPAGLKFGLSFPASAPATKLDASPADDIENLYLIVFDGNGYFTEYVQAEIGDGITHEGHSYERVFTATLTQTDRPRIIHFVTNCPEEQIVYGHEADVIGAMTVSGGTPAYWHRLEVDSILDEDGDGLMDAVSGCIPMVRNFAEINVAVEENEYTANFTAESFYLYNDIDKGTVAPYNISSKSFQNFLGTDGLQLDYDVLLGTYGYEGHAVSDVKLNPAPTDESGFMAVGSPWYMYERKISARTEDEQSWLESPNHIIIKGTFDGAPAYYKVDLVRTVTNTDASGVISQISQYYNILRNFRYTFTVTNVHSAGYSTLAGALANPAGNNLSGSVDTQGLVNLSDGEGRIFVSYTDTTLVSGDAITLRYRYVPSLQEPDVTANDEVHFHDIDGGNVIQSYVNGAADDADGWRTLTIQPYAPGMLTQQQSILLHHTNANLSREVSFILQKPYEMSVTCSPDEVEAEVQSEFTISVSIPDDLPEHMFPLDFAIEADAMSIAPVAPEYKEDGSHISDQIPVYNGQSHIPGKNEVTFHYLKTLTWDAYNALTSSNSVKTFTMDFQTNKAASTSKVYVTNKYFSAAYDWIYTSGTTVIENVTINFSWQSSWGATQTIHVYDASGAEVADAFEYTTGSGVPVSMVLYGVTDNNATLYFRFTNAAGTTYVASNTLQQVKDGQTLNFNAE